LRSVAGKVMSKKIILASIFVSLAVLASSCGESVKLATSTPQPSNITLMGTVYELIWNGATFVRGDAVAGAHVRLDGESGTWSTTSNANGEYSFQGIPDGNYTITVTGEGYLFTPVFSQQISVKPADKVPADNTIMTLDIGYYVRLAYITSYSPAPGSIVPTDQGFTVTFNTPMDTSTVTFRLVPQGFRASAAEGDTVQVDQSWSSDNRTVTITPQGNLVSNEVYQLLLNYDNFSASPPFYPLGAQGERYMSRAFSGTPFLDILYHYATYETSAGGVPGAPSNLQVVINGKTTSEVDYSDVETATNDIALYWEPSSAGNVTGYRVYVAQSGSVNNYAPLMDVTPASWTTNNYFNSQIIKVMDALHAMSVIDPIGTGNYPFINNTVYFKVVAFNGDGESGGVVVSARDVKGPDAVVFQPFFKAGYAGGVLANNYYLPPIGALETDRVYVSLNEPIDPASVVAGNFSLDGGLNVVSATFLTNCFEGISLNWRAVVEIVADGDLTGRTLTVTSGVKDLAGNGVETGTGDTFGPF